MATRTVERTLDAMPDTIDFRDVMYSPALIEIPPVSDLESYRAAGIPILDQGSEGACTGFGLATVANFLLRGRGRKATADETSAWMLYAMAKRYDEWPGEQYSGSSARAAMKGWHKHGVCGARLWKDIEGSLTDEISADAIKRPIGAYFRVNHKDLVAIHAAIAEVGMLYATARVHRGWQNVETNGVIEYSPDITGGHAFAIVGYDQSGLWIQNSWGPDWGSGGLARISYSDWLENGTDVWVAALGVPVDLGATAARASLQSSASRSLDSYVYSSLRPHIVTARNDGELDSKGVYGLTPEGLRSIVEDQMPKRMQGWARKRLMLHAHGGLVPESSAVQYVANSREKALAAEAYPLSFIWRSDAWSTIRNILQEAFSRRRDEGLLDKAKDFMLDRLDDTLEAIACLLGGKAMWDEIKENARLATEAGNGAARLTADLLVAQHGKGAIDEIHLVGHSAGAIFQAYLAKYLTDRGVPIASLTLWAPACTIELYKEIYEPRIEDGRIGAFRLFTLDDRTEQDDHCANIYHKSLLYLVSHAFEKRPRIPLIQSGTPLLGLEKDVHKAFRESDWDGKKRRWFVSPAATESDANHHGDFDDDGNTRAATLAMISGARAAPQPARSRPASATSLARRRRSLETASAGIALFR